MRLLDQIAHCCSPVVVQQNDGTRWRLSSACDFRHSLQQTPLRYVLSDGLIRLCTELAYADGTSLAQCLDLLHVPALRVWIEWNESERLAELAKVLPDCIQSPHSHTTARGGALIETTADGRSGVMRTFWNRRDAEHDPLLSSVETHFDLDATADSSLRLERLLDGAQVSLRDDDVALGSILGCVSYRMEESWRRYYAAQRPAPATCLSIARQSLGTVAFDFPILLALFLLQATRCGLPEQLSDLRRLNAKRTRCGKQPLLEHIELSAPVFSPPPALPLGEGAVLRQRARRHHVRGHLVRRQNVIYWRSAHWRGHVRLGAIQSRTVSLHAGFASAARTL